MINARWNHLRYGIHNEEIAIKDDEARRCEARQKSWWALGGAVIAGGLATVTAVRYGVRMSHETAIAAVEVVACGWLGYLSLRKHIEAGDAANDIAWHRNVLAGLQEEYDKRPGRIQSAAESVVHEPYPTVGGFRHAPNQSVPQN